MEYTVLLLLLLKKVGSTRLRESDVHWERVMYTKRMTKIQTISMF